MKMSKKRILFVNEFSELATGFSNYAKVLIRKMYESDKYEIAELGTYIKPNDPRINNVPWKVYPAMPADEDKAGQQEYHKPHNQWGRQQNLGQFGAAVYDSVLIDFQPDYVCSWMDPWMSTIHMDSPLRKYFKWIYMPCIDSTPQRQEWLSMYESADYLLGYSDFAINVMKEQSPRIRVSGDKKLLDMPARPPLDTDVFHPMNKSEVRDKWGIQKDLPIILTCMRNQQRKLFCELLDSFAKYKRSNPKDEIARKAVLLIHSSGFDAGQEYWTHLARLSTLKYIPSYYKDLHQSVLHTFQCDACEKRVIGYAIWLLNANMENGRAYMKCPHCGQMKLRTPNTSQGFTREELAEVFNLANLYVQVSIAGADEMPASEAKACGVPILISQNAAMAEKAFIPFDWEGKRMKKKADGTPYTMHKGGIPIKIAYEFHEAATMQKIQSIRRCG
jgi:glycosyltransferase involved in cell wall biosynthesis